jgi:lysophospholipase L1-like esterase
VRRALVVLALLVLLGGGCGRDAASGGAEVVVIGDSVTAQSTEAIVRAMAGRDITVAGRPGLRSDQLIPVAEDVLAGTGPPIAVVMAGYNDLWQGRDEEDRVADLAETVADADCAIWVLVPTVGPWDRERARALERRVRAAAEEVGMAVEPGWRDAVDGPGGSELVVSDGVHPSEAGRARLAEVMAAAVERECG